MSSRTLAGWSCLALMMSGCGAVSDSGEGANESIGSNAAALTRSVTISATQAWQSTGIVIKPGDQVTVTCTGGLSFPWPGHAGFNCVGDPSTHWDLSLAPACAFGSLIYKIGSSPAFCNGTAATNLSGVLSVAFNDGVNFNDNSGGWSASIHVARPWIGMPFSGQFASNAANPVNHALHDADHITEWSTDLYAVPGTAVTFRGAPWLTYSVTLVTATSCPPADGNPNVGQTVFIDAFLPGTQTRIGRVTYGHLDAVAVRQFQNISVGTQLGTTRLWSRVADCYDVQTNAQVHTHFELGTNSGGAGAGNSACWQPSVGVQVATNSPIGYFGTTGLTGKQQCAMEP